jgi:hypothetical protein
MIRRRLQEVLSTQLTCGDAAVIFALLAFADWRWDLL